MHASGLAAPVFMITCLFFLATLSAIWLRHMKFPYTIGLVLIGIGLGLLGHSHDFFAPILNIHISTDLIMYVILPVLIFDAAINIKVPLLKKNLVPIMLLAVFGVIISTLLVAGILTGLTPLSLSAALLFGALISATDPVAVIALFKEVGAPERISLLMDAESLFNDATAIVMFGIVFSLVSAGMTFDMSTVFGIIWQFCWVFFGGLIVGGFIGYASSSTLKLATEMPYVQIAHTTVIAYASFIIADHFLGMSGVMSTIATGLVIRARMEDTFGEKARTYLYPHWDFMAFVANSYIFLLMGLQEDFIFTHSIPNILTYTVLAIGAVTLARLVVIYTLIPAYNWFAPASAIDKGTRLVMFWGGLRGVVPIALMLSIPDSFPEKGLIIYLTLVVILFSLLIQGTTIKTLLDKIKSPEPTKMV